MKKIHIFAKKLRKTRVSKESWKREKNNMK
jgi:hypothetical protein